MYCCVQKTYIELLTRYEWADREAQNVLGAHTFRTVSKCCLAYCLDRTVNVVTTICQPAIQRRRYAELIRFVFRRVGVEKIAWWQLLCSRYNCSSHCSGVCLGRIFPTKQFDTDFRSNFPPLHVPNVRRLVSVSLYQQVFP